MPKKGYGQLSLMARKIGVHTTLISQVLKGHKELTTDQAAAIADYFGMNEGESEYFVLLVQHERAGNPSSKKIYSKQLLRLKENAQKISNRISVEAKLTEEQRAIFYSDWIYSAVRQTVALIKDPSPGSIGNYLGLSSKKVQSVLDFLIQTGLLKMNAGRILMGPASTHLESDSPWIKVHHNNWRQKAIQSMARQESSELYYSAPMTLSKKDAELIQEKIIQFIEQINTIVDPSPSEELCCLNIDWFRVTSNTF